MDVRIKRIENRLRTFLREYLRKAKDLESFNITVTQLNTLSVVHASTTAIPNFVSLITVTEDDAEIYGMAAPWVGVYFAERVRQGLVRACREWETSYMQ